MMPKKRKKQSSRIVLAVLILSILAALGILVYFSYCFVKKAYISEKMKIAREISEIKILTDEQIRRDAAKSANLEYPVAKPLKTPEQIAKEAEAAARKMTDEKFNPKLLAEQIADIIKSSKEATPGQKIEFISRNAKSNVRGVYKGRDGIFVLVDTQKYSIRDISDEYRYLFDSNLATARTQEKISELRTFFKEESAKYLEENRKKIQDELSASSGYMKFESGSWHAKSDIFDEAFESLKLQKEKERQEEIKRIFRNHKLFGVYSFPGK